MEGRAQFSGEFDLLPSRRVVCVLTRKTTTRLTAEPTKIKQPFRRVPIGVFLHRFVDLTIAKKKKKVKKHVFHCVFREIFFRNLQSVPSRRRLHKVSSAFHYNLKERFIYSRTNDIPAREMFGL